jgi:anti-anti-sigma factor
MEFNTKEYKRSIVVKVDGRIDSYTALDLENALMKLVPAGKGLILDMESVEFVSSAGWWAIIRVQKEVKKVRNDLVLVALHENVRDSMDLIGILPYFNVYDDLVSAIGDA